MHIDRHAYLGGIFLTGLIAVTALILAALPGFSHFGALTLALLLGLGIRWFRCPHQHHHAGIGFSARQLLRIGIVLLGVRLNYALLLHAGPRIFLLDASVIVAGLAVITALGRWLGLPGVLPLLMAVDSSICGASAVAAVGPVIRATSEDMALVIPIGSLVGTAGVLGLTFLQNWMHLRPATFGVMAGATLHEVAQVLAASSTVPGALAAGTVTKLVRVVMLAPVVLLLSLRMRPAAGAAGTAPRGHGILAPLKSLWFVGGFLAAGAANTAVAETFPAHEELLAQADGAILSGATFLMAMAMAGLGLLVDFDRLRHSGLRTAAAGIAGWLLLVALAAAETWGLRL